MTQDEEDTEADVLDVQAEDWEGEELDDTFNEEDDEDWEDEEDWPEEDDDELDEDDEEDWPDDEWVSDRWRKP